MRTPAPLPSAPPGAFPDPSSGLEEACAAAPQDWAQAAAFALSRIDATADPRPLVFVAVKDFRRERGGLSARGLAGLGIGLGRLILVRAERETEALWAMEEALKSGAVAGVVAAAERPAFVATRRLDFAAQKGRAAAVLLRVGRAEDLSAARLRWRISALPSAADPFDPRAPGLTRLKAELTRRRNGLWAHGIWSRMMRRIVSVWLPDWPITVWSTAAGRTPPDGPFVLTERTTHGLVLAAANPAARMLGLRRGQAHADASAIAPQLEGAPAEPERQAFALKRLALWAERFSPAVAADALQPGMEGLFLDMTGGAHLFGGEGALVREIERRLEAAGSPARAALADTPGAAWALARFGDEKVAPPGRTREALAGLPVESLRLQEPALKLLRRFGLRRIGDLYPLPRSGLARRFGAEAGMELVRRLDQVLGAEPEPLEPVRPAPLYRAWQAFAEPLIDIEGVGHVLPPLVQALAGQLERDGKGARRLVLTAFRVDGRTTSIEAGLSAPGAAPAHLLRLLRERGLERLDLGFGADALMVCADKAETARTRQTDLADGHMQGGVGDGGGLAALIDRIEAKLGDGSALRPALVESHIPERSEAWLRAGPEGPAGTPAPAAPRPLFLLDPPEPIEALAELPDSAPARFVWRRVTRRVLRAEGPERLSPEWWKPAPGPREPRTRDYYRVEDEDGRRYWLFREGLYGREDAGRAPSWWLHGVFA